MLVKAISQRALPSSGTPFFHHYKWLFEFQKHNEFYQKSGKLQKNTGHAIYLENCKTDMISSLLIWQISLYEQPSKIYCCSHTFTWSTCSWSPGLTLFASTQHKGGPARKWSKPQHLHCSTNVATHRTPRSHWNHATDRRKTRWTPDKIRHKCELRPRHKFREHIPYETVEEAAATLTAAI